jgi:hypothetical protein
MSYERRLPSPHCTPGVEGRAVKSDSYNLHVVPPGDLVVYRLVRGGDDFRQCMRRKLDDIGGGGVGEDVLARTCWRGRVGEDVLARDHLYVGMNEAPGPCEEQAIHKTRIRMRSIKLRLPRPISMMLSCPPGLFTQNLDSLNATANATSANDSRTAEAFCSLKMRVYWL